MPAFPNPRATATARGQRHLSASSRTAATERGAASNEEKPQIFGPRQTPPPPPLDLLLRRLAAPAMAAAAIVVTSLAPLEALAAALPERASALAASSYPSSTAPPLPTKFRPLRSFSLPRVEQAVLSNGLRVFYVSDVPVAAGGESGGLGTPTARGALLMRGGQRAASPPGVATLATTVQRAGGSVQHPAPGLDERLDDLAAAVEAGAAPDASVVSFECLSEDAAEVLSLVGELVKSPALPADQLSLAKAQVVSALRHRDDSPGAAPGREAARMIYGKGSVFSRNPTVEQVNGIKREDLERYLREWQRPDAAVLTLVGDFGSSSSSSVGGSGSDSSSSSTSKGRATRASATSPSSPQTPSFTAPSSSSAAAKAAFAAAERALGSWAVAEGQPSQPPPIPVSPLADEASWKGKTYLIDRPGLPQASVAFALPGVRLDDDDAPALDLLSGSLNSFGGRLFDGLRTEKGLAYTVSARFDTGQVDHRGLFVAGGSTAKPAEFVQALKQVLREAARDPPAGAELAAAKAEALNSFVFNYADRGSAAARAGAYALLGLPPDYLDVYRARLERVTEAQVAAAARRHLRPDDAVVVVAADAREVKRKGGFLDGEVALPLTVEPVERPSAGVSLMPGGIVVPKAQ